MTIASEWAEAFKGCATGAEFMERKRQGEASPAKPRRKSPEADIQAELVAHVSGPRAIEPLLDGAIVHSHANEGTWKNAKLRGMGVYRGITDLEIVARGGRAYFLEVKVPGRFLTKDEEAFKAWCLEHDTPWAMCDSVVGGLEQLRRWGLLRERGEGTRVRADG